MQSMPAQRLQVPRWWLHLKRRTMEARHSRAVIRKGTFGISEHMILGTHNCHEPKNKTGSSKLPREHKFVGQTEPLIRSISDTALLAAVYRARETERPDALFHDPFARDL